MNSIKILGNPWNQAICARTPVDISAYVVLRAKLMRSLTFIIFLFFYHLIITRCEALSDSKTNQSSRDLEHIYVVLEFV